MELSPRAFKQLANTLYGFDSHTSLVVPAVAPTPGYPWKLAAVRPSDGTRLYLWANSRSLARL